MKRVYGLMMGILLAGGLIGCRKEALISNDRLSIMPISRGLPPFIPTVFPRIPFRGLEVAAECINSYNDIIRVLEGSTVSIGKVVLEDGTELPVGGDLISITYSAIPGGSSHSIFTSHLEVRHNVQGYIQTLTSDVWSLGCVYTMTGIPVFTNIKEDNEIILINTCLFWNIGVHSGKAIQYLIVG